MKYPALLIIGLITFNSFSQDYLLKDKNEKKHSLANLIMKSIEEEKLNNNPLIIVNEKVLDEDELNQLNFSSDDILEIALVDKNNAVMQEIYGSQAINGVILIETKPIENNNK